MHDIVNANVFVYTSSLISPSVQTSQFTTPRIEILSYTASSPLGRI